MLQPAVFHASRIVSITPSILYESRRFGWRRRKKRSRKALAQRRTMGLESMESRRDLFPDLEPTTDNFPLYQSFLEKHKLGLILNEVFRLKYYNTLFPALDTMSNTLCDHPQPIPTITHIDYATTTPQTSQTINENNTENEQEIDEYDEDETEETEEETEEEDAEDDGEYDYEYEYEYETDEEFEDDEEPNNKKET